MATYISECEITPMSYDDFGIIFMKAMEPLANYNASFDGEVGEIEEISAPTVGMGMNTWQRGRSYSTVYFEPETGLVQVETKIKGFTGALFNSKYAKEVADMLTSKIKYQTSVSKKEKPVPISVADELLKLKSLLDSGLISQDDFEIQKNKILNR